MIRNVVFAWSELVECCKKINLVEPLWLKLISFKRTISSGKEESLGVDRQCYGERLVLYLKKRYYRISRVEHRVRKFQFSIEVFNLRNATRDRLPCNYDSKSRVNEYVRKVWNASMETWCKFAELCATHFDLSHPIPTLPVAGGPPPAAADLSPPVSGYG